MSDRQEPGMARQDESENARAISSDETVLDFLWDSETPAASDGPAEAGEGRARQAAEGGDLAGALARYGSWLSSLD